MLFRDIIYSATTKEDGMDLNHLRSDTGVCIIKQVARIQDLFASPNNCDHATRIGLEVINMLRQPRVSDSNYDCVPIKGVGPYLWLMANMDRSGAAYFSHEKQTCNVNQIWGIKKKKHNYRLKATQLLQLKLEKKLDNRQRECVKMCILINITISSRSDYNYTCRFHQINVLLQCILHICVAWQF